MADMSVPRPSADYVRRRLPSKGKEDEYWEADLALAPVFARWPENRDLGQVLAKVTLLNALYATRIMNVYPVAHRILDLDIDERLRSGDSSLVADIANTRDGDKKRFRLSFATKYCAWHEPEKFQIFDSNVAWMLCEYRRAFAFDEVKWENLRDYGYFVRVIDAFCDHFGLREFTRKQIDKFLWREADRIWEEREAAKAKKLRA
jgi:hypothetical protein